MSTPRCNTCGGVCLWAEDAWTCAGCGDEWDVDHDLRYAPPDWAGWVVRVTRVYKSIHGEIVTYWYGPGNGWGTTSGPLDEAQVFPTKTASEAALRKIFGVPRAWGQRGYQPVRLAEVRKALR